MSDPIDPNTGRGKKEDGWKTVVMPTYQGTQPPGQNAGPQGPGPQSPGVGGPAQNPGQLYPPPSQGGPGQSAQGGYGQPPAGNYPPPSSASGQPQNPFAPPSPASSSSADKTQLYPAGGFPPSSQGQPFPPSSSAAPSSADKTQLYPAGGFPPPPYAGQQHASSPQPSYPPTSTPSYQQNPSQPQYPPAYGQQYGQPPKKRKTWLWVLLIILSLIALFFVGCMALVYKGVKGQFATTPERAVKLLHDRMESHNDSAIYAMSDPAYKQRVSREENDAEFDRIYNNLGAPKSYQILETRQVNAPGQDVVNTFVLTTFEKGSANENIQWRKIGGQYMLVAYGAESDNLR